MGFFDRILTGKVYRQERRNPRLVCEMSLLGERILLEEMDMDFDRDTNGRHVPLYVVFLGAVSEAMEDWIMSGSKTAEGRLAFYRNTEQAESNAVFIMIFDGAVCVRYRRSVRGDVPAVTLVMSARHVQVLNVDLI
jgi:hypothetical protein